MRISGLLLLAASLAATAGCGGKKDGGKDIPVQRQEEERPTVEYIVLKPSEFADEVLSNGVLASARKAVVKQ